MHNSTSLVLVVLVDHQPLDLHLVVARLSAVLGDEVLQHASHEQVDLRGWARLVSSGGGTGGGSGVGGALAHNEYEQQQHEQRRDLQEVSGGSLSDLFARDECATA